VSRLLASEHGLPVVDADVIARDILEPCVTRQGRLLSARLSNMPFLAGVVLFS
jgi:dephospho-CoA kinase